MSAQTLKPVHYMFEAAKKMLGKEFSVIQEEVNFMDVFGFNPGGDCCEIEIKTADYDFYKEFKKEQKVEKHAQYLHAVAHGDASPYFVPTRFYFFVLSNFTERAYKYLEKKGLPYGLIEYNSLKNKVRVIKKSDQLRKSPFGGEFTEWRKKFKDYPHKRTYGKELTGGDPESIRTITADLPANNAT